MALIDTIAGNWAVDDSGRLPEHVDVIALVSIGSTATGASNGMRATIGRALELWDRYGYSPWIVYGAFTGNGERTLEEDHKRQIFSSNSFFVGKVMTTIGECLAYKAAFPNAKSIIFVTEEAHSRRARLIWKCLWPEAEIYIVSVKLANTIDKGALMKPYRNAWAAFICQAAPTVIYKPVAMMGPKTLKLLGNFHQPTSKG